jgi:ketosteroid isomerase-like protein
VSQANVDLVRRMMEAYDRGDHAELYAGYHPDIEMHVARLVGDQLGFDPVYVGVDGIRRFFREWLESWETIAFDYEEFIDAGDHVVVVLSQRMRGRVSGVELNRSSYAQVWTVADDKLVRSEFFLSRVDALEAVGLGG